ncbi:hypothetical protein FRC16_001648 [Serendipita sp. 398]|nr:hypothetical protein FRC16_001648 [Serendipita sp. 398]
MSMDLTSYLAQRAQLIAEDTSLRVDLKKLASLTPTESAAESIVRKIRNAEAEKIWSHKNEDLEHPFPGMAFLTAKTTIESTRLFKIVKDMPKGALLHAHLEATVDARVLLELAIMYENICVRTSGRVTAENIGSILPDFYVMPKGVEYDTSPSITSEGYNPDSHVSTAKARNDWPEALGGPEGFDTWVIRGLTINPQEAYGTHNTAIKIWDKFITCFSVSRGILGYEPVYRRFLRHLFESCVEDGISYAEIRMNFTIKTIMVREDGVTPVDHEGFFMVFQEVLAGYLEELAQAGQSDLFLGAKLIYTIVRVISKEDLEWYLDDCLSLKQKFPAILAGFDIVGPEDTCKPLIDYLEPLIAFRRKCEQMGFDFPFLFHAGETLGDGNSVDQNLYDAILLGTKRIGHAFSIIKHPVLMKICRERNICCERLTSSIPAHPFPAMLNHGVPIALGSDDPGIFGNLGLSYDFFQVLVSSEISGLITLGVLARQSLEHALLDDVSRKRALQAWDQRWERFVEQIVAADNTTA